MHCNTKSGCLISNAHRLRWEKASASGMGKSADVSDWAGLWLRVDKEREKVAFDNMQDRRIKGTQPWKMYDVVLDVPANATSIHFGVLLSGTGEVRINDVSLEVVDMNSPQLEGICRKGLCCKGSCRSTR